MGKGERAKGRVQGGGGLLDTRQAGGGRTGSGLTAASCGSGGDIDSSAMKYSISTLSQHAASTHTAARRHPHRQRQAWLVATLPLFPSSCSPLCVPRAVTCVQSVTQSCLIFPPLHPSSPSPPFLGARVAPPSRYAPTLLARAYTRYATEGLRGEATVELPLPSRSAVFLVQLSPLRGNVRALKAI